MTIAAANPATARLLEDLGATSINLPVDLSLAQIAAVRQAIDAPIDFYVESPDDFGGLVRHYETPALVRVAAPIYLKYGLRNSGLYPSGMHIENMVINLSRERVRRAALSLALLKRFMPEAIRVSRMESDADAAFNKPADWCGARSDRGGHGSRCGHAIELRRPRRITPRCHWPNAPRICAPWPMPWRPLDPDCRDGRFRDRPGSGAIRRRTRPHHWPNQSVRGRWRPVTFRK